MVPMFFLLSVILEHLWPTFGSDSVAILKDFVPETSSFANIRQFAVQLIREEASGMYHVAQSPHNYTATDGWQLQQTWDKVQDKQSKERYSLHWSIKNKRGREKQSEWKVMEWMEHEKKEMLSVFYGKMHEFPNWLSSLITIKNPGKLIIALEERDEETQKIEDYSRDVYRLNVHAEREIQSLRSSKERMRLERDDVRKHLELSQLDFSAKCEENKELQRKLDHQACENEARLQSIRAGAGPQKPKRKPEISDLKLQIYPIIRQSLMKAPVSDVVLQMQVTDKSIGASVHESSNEEQALFARLQRDKDAIIDDLKKKQKEVMKSFNSTQGEVHELQHKIEQRDIRLRAMNHSMFGQTEQAFKSQTKLKYSSHESNMSRVDVLNKQKREVPQTNHELLLYGVIGGGVGVAVIMLLLFGIICCFRKYRRKSRKKHLRLSVKPTKEGTFKVAPLKDWKSNKMTQGDNQEGNDINAITSSTTTTKDTEHLDI